MIRRALAAAFVLAFPSAPQAPAPEAREDEPKFVFQWMPIFGRRMDTVVYDFNGDGRPDVLNTSIDFDASPPTRWFALHLRDEKGDLPNQPTFFWQADDRAAALVFGNFSGGPQVDIGFLATDGVYYYPWEGKRLVETPKKLLHVRTFFTTVPSSSIPIWGMAEDLDGDGRHDLIVPTAEGYRIYFQTEPGKFGTVADLEKGLPDAADKSISVEQFAEKSEITASHFSANRQLPRLATADINGDGKIDLLTVHKDVVTYFLQTKEGRQYPSKRSHRFKYTIPTLHEEVKKDTVNLSQISFLDINNDKLADLVVTKIEGTLGLTESVKTRIYVHLGTGRGNFVADKFIKIDGVSIDPQFISMTGNGCLDVLTSRLRTDLLRQGLEAYVLGDITITYEVFQFDPETGNYLEEPVWSKDVRVTRKDLEEKGIASIAIVQIAGDFNGDGRPDLVFLDPKTEILEIRRGRVHYRGKREVIGFEENAFTSIQLERHPKWMSILDSNNDGIADIFLMYGGSVGILESRRK